MQPRRGRGGRGAAGGVDRPGRGGRARARFSGWWRTSTSCPRSATYRPPPPRGISARRHAAERRSADRRGDHGTGVRRQHATGHAPTPATPRRETVRHALSRACILRELPARPAARGSARFCCEEIVRPTSRPLQTQPVVYPIYVPRPLSASLVSRLPFLALGPLGARPHLARSSSASIIGRDRQVPHPGDRSRPAASSPCSSASSAPCSPTSSARPSGTTATAKRPGSSPRSSARSSCW